MIRLAFSLLCAAWVCSGQAATYYSADDLHALAGKPVSDAYLVGTFIFVRQITADTAAFISFKEGVKLGKELVMVQFHDNEPPNLSGGKLIRTTTNDPLSLREVTQENGGIVTAFTEYFGTP